jgi:hypothetical protein
VALETDEALHTSDRGKRNGAFEIETPTGVRQFIVDHGSRLDDFDAFVQRFRS